ncbi:MAG: hypothetical protein WAT66_10815 [Actinomycetota bacterium]
MRRATILLIMAAVVGLLFAVTPAKADRQCLDVKVLGNLGNKVCVPCYYNICDLLPPPG